MNARKTTTRLAVKVDLKAGGDNGSGGAGGNTHSRL
jgi:hypothetical protein